MRLLTLEDTIRLVDMNLTLTALATAYRDLAEGRAACSARHDLLSPGPVADSCHCLKSMSGSLPRWQVSALRLTSDIITWPAVNGRRRRVKIAAAPGGRWVGLVLLFSHSTGEPLALFPDGHVQRMRVGGTGGLGTRYLSRPESRVLALIGSGWQAGAALLAACSVRPIRQVRVYSPNAEHCRSFAVEMSRQTGVEVVAAPSAEAACRGADIISCATNSLEPVVFSRWIEPGMHLTCIRPHEFDAEVYARCSRIVVHSRRSPAEWATAGTDSGKEAGEPTGDAGGGGDGRPELCDLMAGKAQGRQHPAEITAFVNNLGNGLQFAALGAALLERATQQGVGIELPAEWFLQSVPS